MYRNDGSEVIQSSVTLQYVRCECVNVWAVSLVAVLLWRKKKWVVLW
jgi:hypothetical protein